MPRLAPSLLIAALLAGAALGHAAAQTPTLDANGNRVVAPNNGGVAVAHGEGEEIVLGDIGAGGTDLGAGSGMITIPAPDLSGVPDPAALPLVPVTMPAAIPVDTAAPVGVVVSDPAEAFPVGDTTTDAGTEATSDAGTDTATDPGSETTADPATDGGADTATDDGTDGETAPAVAACGDYPTWYDAQTAYEAQGGVDGDSALADSLDPDRDGIACEEMMV